MHIMADVLKGLLQTLIFTDDPGSAYEICEAYTPTCDVALPYGAVYTSDYPLTFNNSGVPAKSSVDTSTAALIKVPVECILR